MNNFIPATIDDVDGCHSLFLLEIREQEDNSLLLVVGESSLSEHNKGETAPVQGAERVAHSSGDRVFEICWDSYVAYVVMNESFALHDDEPDRQGRLFVRFKGSKFLDYVQERTWDDDRFWVDGHARRHWQINCESHSIEVVATEEPAIRLRA